MIHDQVGVVRYIADAEWDDPTVQQQALDDMREELIETMKQVVERGAAGPITITVEIVLHPPKDWPLSARIEYGAPDVRAGSVAMKAELVEGEPDGAAPLPIRWRWEGA